MKNFNYENLSKRPEQFLRYTGLRVEQFEGLVERIKPLWEEAEIKRLSREGRKRNIGGGRKYYLKTVEDKVLLVLVFYKLYLTHELLGYFFGIHNSNVCRLIKRMEPILSKILDIKVLRRRKKRIGSIEELIKIYPDIEEIIIDATEQQIQRPKNKRKNKRYYSGKKKRHTIKTQVMIETKSGKILNISNSVAGSIHDYKLFKGTNIWRRLPPCIPIYLDKGYQGIKEDYKELNTILPYKATRSHKLTRSEKIVNKKLASIRVKVEHIIAYLKKFKILGEIYRSKIEDYNKRFKIIAGLINYKKLGVVGIS